MDLLWSLLVFNLGIEAVQLSIILVVFPPLLLLRRRMPRTATVLGVVVTAVVLLFGLLWFAMRILGLPGTPESPAAAGTLRGRPHLSAAEPLACRVPTCAHGFMRRGRGEAEQRHVGVDRLHLPAGTW
jgi:hypothetical protein